MRAHKYTKHFFSVCLLFALLLTPMSAYAAGSATISLTASPSAVVQNSNVTITVNVDVGSATTDGVETKVSFDAAKFSYVSGSISYTDSPLNSDSPSFAVGSNYIVFSRYKSVPPGPTGSFKLATFSLKALVNSGSSALSIDKSSSTVGDHYNAGADILNSVSGATVSFTAPAATSSGTPTTTTTTTTTPKTTSTKPKSSSAPATNDPVVIVPESSNTPDVGAESALPEETELVTKSPITATTKPAKSRALLYGLLGAGTIVLLAGAAGGVFMIKKHRGSLHTATTAATPIQPVEPLNTPNIEPVASEPPLAADAAPESPAPVAGQQPDAKVIEPEQTEAPHDQDPPSSQIA